MNEGPWLMLLLVMLVGGSAVVFNTCQIEQQRADCYERSCTVGYAEFIKNKCVCVVGEMKN